MKIIQKKFCYLKSGDSSWKTITKRNFVISSPTQPFFECRNFLAVLLQSETLDVFNPSLFNSRMTTRPSQLDWIPRNGSLKTTTEIPTWTTAQRKGDPTKWALLMPLRWPLQQPLLVTLGEPFPKTDPKWGQRASWKRPEDICRPKRLLNGPR